MSTVQATDTKAVLEAECRQQMAKLAKMPRRGWDSERRFEAEAKLLDAMLDDFNEAQ